MSIEYGSLMAEGSHTPTLLAADDASSVVSEKSTTNDPMHTTMLSKTVVEESSNVTRSHVDTSSMFMQTRHMHLGGRLVQMVIAMHLVHVLSRFQIGEVWRAACHLDGTVFLAVEGFLFVVRQSDLKRLGVYTDRAPAFDYYDVWYSVNGIARVVPAFLLVVCLWAIVDYRGLTHKHNDKMQLLYEQSFVFWLTCLFSCHLFSSVVFVPLAKEMNIVVKRYALPLGTFILCFWFVKSQMFYGWMFLNIQHANLLFLSDQGFRIFQNFIGFFVGLCVGLICLFDDKNLDEEDVGNSGTNTSSTSVGGLVASSAVSSVLLSTRAPTDDSKSKSSASSSKNVKGGTNSEPTEETSLLGDSVAGHGVGKDEELLCMTTSVSKQTSNKNINVGTSSCSSNATTVEKEYGYNSGTSTTYTVEITILLASVVMITTFGLYFNEHVSTEMARHRDSKVDLEQLAVRSALCGALVPAAIPILTLLTTLKGEEQGKKLHCRSDSPLPSRSVNLLLNAFTKYVWVVVFTHGMVFHLTEVVVYKHHSAILRHRVFQGFGHIHDIQFVFFCLALAAVCVLTECIGLMLKTFFGCWQQSSNTANQENHEVFGVKIEGGNNKLMSADDKLSSVFSQLVMAFREVCFQFFGRIDAMTTYTSSYKRTALSPTIYKDVPVLKVICWYSLLIVMVLPVLSTSRDYFFLSRFHSLDNGPTWFVLQFFGAMCGLAASFSIPAYLMYPPVVREQARLPSVDGRQKDNEAADESTVQLLKDSSGVDEIVSQLEFRKLYVRITTRGTNPTLVKETAMSAFDAMEAAREQNPGCLSRFVIEVVTDNALNLQDRIQCEKTRSHIEEIIVPVSYDPPGGCKYKARALNYAVSFSTAGPEDWIVHLDEETRFTASTVMHIRHFIINEEKTLAAMEAKGKSDDDINDTRQFPKVGQGVIVYGCGENSNWVCTLADSLRVADDFGKFRMCYQGFNRPLIGMHGSFVVCRTDVEQTVTFDHGINGSITEDTYFILVAASDYGVGIDYIDEYMYEQSPFCMWDFVKQRSRWACGIYLCCKAQEINFQEKFFLCLLTTTWFCCPISVILAFMGVMPIGWGLLLRFFCCVNYAIGLFTTFSARDGVLRLSSIFAISLSFGLWFSLLEAAGIIHAAVQILRGRECGFYIVQKEKVGFNTNVKRLLSRAQNICSRRKGQSVRTPALIEEGGVAA